MICHDLDLVEIRRVWAKIRRVLSNAGVVAWWVREIAKKTNRVHYHLIVASDHTGDDIKALIRKSNPELSFRLQFDPIENTRIWANYLCKSTEFAGKESFHAAKVVLFAEGIQLEKHNEIGNFWQKESVLKKYTPAEKAAFREYNHQLAEAENDALVQDAAFNLADATGTDSDAILKHYAEQLILDPTLYQQYADDARDYRIKELNAEPDWDYDCELLCRHHRTFDRYVVDPFVFTKPLPLPRPPVRKKAFVGPRYTPAFDPSRCESYTIGLNGMELITL